MSFVTHKPQKNQYFCSMKKIASFSFFIGILWIATQLNPLFSQGYTNLSPQQFEESINKSDKHILLDVRTPEEFQQSHLNAAINVNVRDQFTANIESLKIDKNAPVYVYCLSGGRSASASAQLAAAGFTQVYNMSGGISTWIGEKRPVISQAGALEKGMSVDDFQKLIYTRDSAVFIDFYAPWCAPCQKMKAFLPELQKEYGQNLKIVMINYDQHPKLIRELGINSVPYLRIISAKGKQTDLKDYHSKEELLAILKE